MRRTTLQTILVAGMVLLAGCAGSLSGSPSPSPSGSGDGGVGGAGTVAFYISDQPNAIEDFEHLNVTISQIGFQQADDDDGDTDDMDPQDPDNATEQGNPDTEGEADDPDNESDSGDSENGTDAPSPEDGTESDDDDEAEADDEDETEADDEGEDDDESGSWIEYDVDNRTVDLTELVGDNATRLAEFDVPNGTYTKVFVHVSEVEATLETGETVNVKLPSNKLQLNKPFEVGDGDAVDFVFDIAVHKAGNSGKYILRPVIGESGTDVPIDRIDDDDDREDADIENAINATFVGDVVPGENATVAVTNASEPVANATVAVKGDVVGVTDSEGRLTFVIPDGEELEVEIRHGDAEAELEREFEAEEEPQQMAGTPTSTAAS